ncbi:hypothetical protein EUA34_12515, partial [Neisseria meningitidis]
NIEQKVGKIRKVLHFENEIEHKILVTYVIAKVSGDLRNARTVIPATFRHSYESGNLGRRVKKTYIPSFPRKRESRISDFQIIFEYCCCSKV